MRRSTLLNSVNFFDAAQRMFDQILKYINVACATDAGPKATTEDEDDDDSSHFYFTHRNDKHDRVQASVKTTKRTKHTNDIPQTSKPHYTNQKT